MAGTQSSGLHPLRWLSTLVVLLVAAYGVGFVVFASSLPHRPGPLDHPDAIVVLTGGGSRLDTAVSLFEHGVGRRLLITGVNTAASRLEVKKLVHGGKRFDCCADLGRFAANTRGNATETADWSRRHGYKRLVIVTASYHMPRSLNEFSAAMPGVTLEPYPVDPESVDIRRWWLHPGAIRLLHAEYTKYLASLVLTRAVNDDERRALDPGLEAIDARAAASGRLAHRSL